MGFFFFLGFVECASVALFAADGWQWQGRGCGPITWREWCLDGSRTQYMEGEILSIWSDCFPSLDTTNRENAHVWPILTRVSSTHTKAQIPKNPKPINSLANWDENVGMFCILIYGGNTFCSVWGEKKQSCCEWGAITSHWFGRYSFDARRLGNSCPSETKTQGFHWHSHLWTPYKRLQVLSIDPPLTFIDKSELLHYIN